MIRPPYSLLEQIKECMHLDELLDRDTYPWLSLLTIQGHERVVDSQAISNL